MSVPLVAASCSPCSRDECLDPAQPSPVDARAAGDADAGFTFDLRDGNGLEACANSQISVAASNGHDCTLPAAEGAPCNSSDSAPTCCSCATGAIVAYDDASTNADEGGTLDDAGADANHSIIYLGRECFCGRCLGRLDSCHDSFATGYALFACK